MALSDRQKRILTAIEQSLETRGFPPTVREICDVAGISSTSVVNYNLKRLEEKGYLVRKPEVSRGIRLLGDLALKVSDSLIRVPLLGRIAAGAPLPVPDGDFSPFAEETLALTRDLVPEEAGIYALEVRGDSMIDALINDGDLVVMKHQTVADNGDLVAVWLRDERETTLKRFYREGDRVRLQPANPSMQPIYAHPANVEIQGKVLLVIRQPEKRRAQLVTSRQGDSRAASP